MRVGIALLIIADLLLRARDLSAHYCNSGVFPVRALGKMFPTLSMLSVHARIETELGMGLLFAFQILLALLLLIGYRTRLATLLSWYLMLSLQWRNPIICDGGDKYLVLILLWGLLLPWHARFSVDSALSTIAPPRSNRFVSPATAGLLLQLALVYLITAIVKLSGDMWRDGSAISVALHYEGAVTRLGQMLLNWPDALRILTYVVIAFELVVFFMLLCPFANGPVRAVTLLLLIFMHASFGVFLKLGIFPLIAIAGLIGVMPSWLVDKIANRLRREPVMVFYDGGCGFCKKSVMLLRTFLGLSDTEVRPAQDDPNMLADMREHNSWIVVDNKSERHRRCAALAVLVGASPIWWWASPVLRWSPVRVVGDWVYRWIADHRNMGSRFLFWMRFRPVHFSRAFQQPVALLLIVLMFYCGWVGVTRAYDDPTTDPYVERLAQVFKLDQRWNMYAKKGLHTGWVVAAGLFSDGVRYELIRGGTPVEWDKPELISATYPNVRWEMWIESLPIEGNQLLCQSYTHYLKRKWNEIRKKDARLIKIELYFMLNRVFGEQQAQIPDRIRIGEWSANSSRRGGQRPGRSR